MESQPVDLSAVVGNMTKMLKRIIGENINLQCQCAEGLPHIQGDIGMMEQVLVNLVVNARDAMPHGGCLQVTVEKTRIPETEAQADRQARAGEFICLTVRDNGTGIDPEHLPRIFEPFFTTKEIGKGTGLGLATVYGIVKQHLGWVGVTSQVGEGATFKIFLPTIATFAGIPAKSAKEADLRGGSETILLVEDELAVRVILCRMLETYGYKVFDAGSGPEALRIWAEHANEIALLVTDIMMPEGLTGRELAEQMRATRPQLRTIFMSGYSAEVLGRNTEFIQRTKSYFLQKPTATRTLIETVRRCLDDA
jgi:two-component system, cell cycle sensor histidine kinase and response regulator CckA